MARAERDLSFSRRRPLRFARGRPIRFARSAGGLLLAAALSQQGCAHDSRAGDAAREPQSAEHLEAVASDGATPLAADAIAKSAPFSSAGAAPFADAGTAGFADAGAEPFAGAAAFADAGPAQTAQAREENFRAQLAALLEQAPARDDAGEQLALEKLDALARAIEEEAPRSGEPSAPWLLAARARRRASELLADRSAAAAPDESGASSARELLAALSVEASACAADAHRSWAALIPAAASSIEAGQAADESLKAAPVAAAEPLYLDALCSAAWARAQGFTFLVEQRAALEAALLRAAALSPLLDDAGPDRELGRLFASLPGYAGGDLSLARAHFEAAIAAAPSAPWNKVLFARTVAVKIQDRALFTQLLNEALALPANTPVALAAKAEARELLARCDDLFGATKPL